MNDKDAKILEAKKQHKEQGKKLDALLKDAGLYRKSQRDLMREKRSKEMEIVVRECADKTRRDEALADPLQFMETYFADRFFMAHAQHHLEMIAAICYVAQYGGDQALSAPRGEGKTTTCTVVLIYAMLKGWVRFPVIVAQTSPHAERIFKDIKNQFENNELLAADFPEICDPVRALEGAPQRGNTQKHNGEPTRIEWKAGHLVMPRIVVDGEVSKFAGVALTYFGLDSAIRGVIINGSRPDFVLIDDPETRESAASPHQIAIRSQIIDRDIAGLGAPQKRIARVMLCTIQNQYCLAYQYTDNKQKASWSGKRFKMLNEWPKHREMWDEYLMRRTVGQQEGDKEGRDATQYYIDNKEQMNVGASVSNPNRFDPTVMPDGWNVEVDALQHCWNIIADFGMDSFLTECQNDPPEEAGAEGSGLTAHSVLTSQNGLQRGEFHRDVQFVTAAIDLGKYVCHWVLIGWLPDATGTIVDYGVAEVAGMGTQTGREAQELALFNTLLQWRTEIMDVEIQPQLVLIDSGDFTETAYAFVRDVGGSPFMVAKGTGGRSFRHGRSSATRRVGKNWFANHLPESGVWLYSPDTAPGKDFVHQRFLTPTIDEAGVIRPATLSLYNAKGDRKRHMSYGHHIVAEERREEFVAGKGLKRWWHQKNRNNHWLDATYMACAAAGMLGMSLPIGEQSKPVIQKKPTAARKPRSIYGNSNGYFNRGR